MSRVCYTYELDKLVKSLQFVPYKLHRNAVHEAGKIYWSSYWSKFYEVLGVDGHLVKIRWNDGKVAEHRTSLDTRRDYELRAFESIELSGGNAEELKKSLWAFDFAKSLTAAEIKALCCADIIGGYVSAYLFHDYFDRSDYRPNDYTYYYLNVKTGDDGVMQCKLLRDLEKSPRPKKD